LAVPITPGRFRSFDGGRTVVYARRRCRGRAGTRVHQAGHGATVVTTVAQRARREVEGGGLKQSIVLLDGERSEGVPGTLRYRVLRFASCACPWPFPSQSRKGQRLDERETAI
jgi:hypothetical protein